MVPVQVCQSVKTYGPDSLRKKTRGNLHWARNQDARRFQALWQVFRGQLPADLADALQRKALAKKVQRDTPGLHSLMIAFLLIIWCPWSQ